MLKKQFAEDGYQTFKKCELFLDILSKQINNIEIWATSPQLNNLINPRGEQWHDGFIFGMRYTIARLAEHFNDKDIEKFLKDWIQWGEKEMAWDKEERAVRTLIIEGAKKGDPKELDEILKKLGWE